MAKKDKLVIERIFNAPVEKVWKYWTEPELFKKWWGPKDFTCPVAEIDFKVGGKSLSCMRGVATPGGEIRDFWSTGTYKEIIPMKKIVTTDSFADKKGNIVPATHYGMNSKMPLEMLITVTFEDAGEGKTKMTLRHEGIPAGKDRDGANIGWSQSFDKLEKLLAKGGA